MTRYIERLTPVAWENFKSDLRRRGLATGKEAMETALVDLAKFVLTLRETERLARIDRTFGKTEAHHASEIIASIQDDLDRQEVELADEVEPPTADFRFVFVHIENASTDQVNKVAGMIADFLKR